MEIQIDPHTLERAQERGTTEDEIRDTLRTGTGFQGKAGRTGKAKVYPFGQERNGKFYEQKRVEVLYVVEEDKIVTVTVYVFYGKWKDANHV